VSAETWSLSPLWIVGVVLILVEEVGLRRLRARSSPGRSRAWRRRGLLYDAGVAIVCLIDSSPLMGTAMSHLTAHMVLHVVEMFYLPVLLVLGAPWVPALFALPVTARRRFLRWWQLGRWRRVTRGAASAVTAPIVGLLAFNGVMLFWHIPRFFNWASWNPWVHTWLMGPSFVVAGYLFWRLILGSHPVGPRASTRFQILAIAVTAFEMLILAIAMGVMSHSAWYEMNVMMLGPADALRDQQTAAGILWICGDFWVIPALFVIARRLIDNSGGVSEAFEKALGRT